MQRIAPFRAILASLALLLAASAGVAIAQGETVERVSTSPTGLEGFAPSQGVPSLSADGRFVAFASYADNFYGLDDNNSSDIFVKDRSSGFTFIASLTNPFGGNRETALGDSFEPSIDASGRYVAYSSIAPNIVTGDGNDAFDVFVRDMNGNNVLVSASSFGAQGDADSFTPSISAAANAVAYASDATNLVGGDGNGVRDVFVTRIFAAQGGLQRGLTVRASTGGPDPDGASDNPSLSGDGRVVAFDSEATNLLPTDTNNVRDVFVRNLQTGILTLASVASDGTQGNGDSYLPAISADGRFVAFVSDASNLVSGDTNQQPDIFVRDLQLGLTERISVDEFGAEGDGPSGQSTAIPGRTTGGRPSISADGRFVTFTSEAENLVFDDFNGVADVFVVDLSLNTIVRASVGDQGEGDGPSIAPAIDLSASTVAFESDATNLTFDDTNLASDVFVIDLAGAGGGNQPPIADAGFDQQVFELQTVFLDASGSFDPDGDFLTFLWTQVDGPPVALNNPALVNPSFTAPLVSFFEILEFEVAVSDGVNPPQFATVFVDVSAAPPAVLTGRVTDAGGSGIPNAFIQVIRADGEEATPAFSDGAGFYTVADVRAGPNTVICTASGLEAEVIELDAPSGVVIPLDIEMDELAARIVGTVLLSDGSPLVGEPVELLDGLGNVLLDAITDGAGEYVINDVNQFVIAQATSLRINPVGVPPWSEANLSLQAGQVNRRDFQYGRLDVLIDARPPKLRNRLGGTLVSVLSGNTVLAESQTGRRARRLRFFNVPAQSLRVRATNPNLSGAVNTVQVVPGRRFTRTTLILRAREVF